MIAGNGQVTTDSAMPHVVFLRAVNVGGHQKFQPSVLARELADFDVISVGAAGTFVVRAKVAEAALRKEILKRLTFEPEMMICPAREILELAREKGFGKEQLEKDVQRFVSVMAKAPRLLPRLPISQPGGDQWEVKIVAVRGRCAQTLRRPRGKRGVYPNEIVEKTFGVPATTRNWTTIAKICDILSE